MKTDLSALFMPRQPPMPDEESVSSIQFLCLCFKSLQQRCRELAWRSGRVMDRHATARGSIPGWNGVFTELLVLRKGQ